MAYGAAAPKEPVRNREKESVEKGKGGKRIIEFVTRVSDDFIE